MGSNCIFYNGQTETGATEFARTPFVDAVKALKQVLQVLFFNAWAIVTYRELIEMPAFRFRKPAYNTIQFR